MNIAFPKFVAGKRTWPTGDATLSGLMTFARLTQGSRAFTAFRRGNPGLDETTPPGLIAARPRHGRSAFTLVEMLLVVTIIGILAGLVIPGLVGKSEHARIIRTQADVHGGIKSALGQFEVDNGSFPHSLQDLVTQSSNAKNWHGPYLEKLPVDAWGNPYIYYFPGKHTPNSYDLLSVGPDGKEGTDDDIVSWN
jgi:general secretion pathway protein G